MPQDTLPVRVPLVTEPWGILKSLNAARQNVLSIIPDIATRQPMVSGKTGKRCECESCVAQYNLQRPFGGLSNYVWGYSNRVAEEVAKTHPDKLVFGYAYQNAFLPPENIERLHPNLAVVMATVWRHRRLHLELHNPAKRNVDVVRMHGQRRSALA